MYYKLTITRIKNKKTTIICSKNKKDDLENIHNVHQVSKTCKRKFILLTPLHFNN